ncbi:MAG: Clp protease ClpP [Dysgonamonadaceae bacterium]|nr:Clp protease ClpP [Dysgonamonadaceae bacterium]
MAKKYDIDIDGYIGSWFSSKRYVKNSLKEAGEKEIIVRVNSRGGIVDDAIDIAAQFEAHGKVTCELFSGNASAATVLTLGAKKVRAHENSAYFIHQAMSWVEAWGYMNEDDIDATIERLNKQKEQNSAITLILAKMYAKKSGKPVKDILDLMKKERWLNAEEAKEWGFVDEIFEDKSIQPINAWSPEMLNEFKAAGLPVPPIRAAAIPDKENPAGLFHGFINELREIFNPTKNIVTMNKTFISINTLLNVEGIEFKNGKAELTEAQVKALNDALADAGKKTEEPAEKNDKPEANQSSDKDAEIKALKEQIEALNKKPGDETKEVNKTTDTPPAEDDDMKEIESARNLYNILP